MDGEQTYEVSRAFSRLPKHVSYACKRVDVDACVAGLGIEVPFDELRFLGLIEIPKAARGGPAPASFEVAKATESFYVHPDYPRVMFRLEIEIIPREFVAPVREALRREGLPALLRWLHERRPLPETARGGNHARHVEFIVADGTLRMWDGDTPAWRDP